MFRRTVPFNYGLFFNAMCNLIGREPDTVHRYGHDGIYIFRYEPKDDKEKLKLSESEVTLQEWLSIFELKLFKSRCEFGKLPRPSADEAGKDYLDIYIFDPIEREVRGR